MMDTDSEVNSKLLEASCGKMMLIYKNSDVENWLLNGAVHDRFLCTSNGTMAREVGVQVNVYSIEDTNVIANHWIVHISLEKFWKPTSVELDQYLERKAVSYIPEVQIYNHVSIQDKKKNKLALYFDGIHQKLCLCEKETMTVTVRHVFDVSYFPIDAHSIQLKVTGMLGPKNDINHLKFVPSFGSYVCCMKSSMNLNDFILDSSVEVDFVKTDESFSKNHQYSVMNVSMTIQRDWRAYFWRYIITIMLISFIGCVPFSFKLETEDGMYNACSYVVTILLTLVAFAMVVNGELPKVSYCTLFQFYFNGICALSALQLLQIMILHFVWKKESFWKLSINIAIWFAFHIVFAIYAAYVRKKQMDAMKDRKILEEKWSYVYEPKVNIALE